MAVKKSIVEGLNEKDMQAVVNTYTLNEFYWPNFFPLKFTPTLTWKALATKLRIPVAADVVSFNSRSPRKTRRVVERLSGDIPKIEIAFDKEETDINEYYSLLHYAGTDDGAKAIVEWVYGDSESCWEGVNARIEWLSLRALSTGKIVLDSENNEGVVTETAVTFNIPEDQQSGVSVIINAANAGTAKPITKIKEIRKAAKKKGVILKHIFTDSDTFDNIVACAETQKICANWVTRSAGMADVVPSLESFNAAMKANKLPEMHIIESMVTIQIKGENKVVEPWETGVMLFTEGIEQGNTYHGPIADEKIDSEASKVKREHVLIKKFSDDDPVKETTKGVANAFPAWGNADRCWQVDTLHTGFLADA